MSPIEPAPKSQYSENPQIPKAETEVIIVKTDEGELQSVSQFKKWSKN